jgi:hypothetical protein
LTKLWSLKKQSHLKISGTIIIQFTFQKD